MISNCILIILESIAKSDEMGVLISKALCQYDIQIVLAENALDGLIKYMECAPCLIIIDVNIQAMNGFSLSAIIRGTKNGEACSIYMVVDEFTLPNAKIDHFITKPINKDLLIFQLQRFFEKRMMSSLHLSEIVRAQRKQSELLPNHLITSDCKVDYIYSPYSDLSGDCLDFWYEKDENGLYGFLFDCTGHDLCSFLQVSEVRTIFRWGFRWYQKNQFYKSLSEIMENVNRELFHSHGDNVSCVAAIIFFLDFKNKVLHYCSAGIPSFYIRKAGTNEYEEIEMCNYLIGYELKAAFLEKNLSIKDVNEVIFSSDGFSELLYKDASHIQNPKHDDVSAIFIQLNQQNSKCVQNEHIKNMEEGCI